MNNLLTAQALSVVMIGLSICMIVTAGTPPWPFFFIAWVCTFLAFLYFLIRGVRE